MQNKVFYQQIVDEITTGEIDRALWAMIWTKAGGDENKAKSDYVERRVSELKSQAARIARQKLIGQWRHELQAVRNNPPWGFLFLGVAASVIYAFWCFHNPPDTGWLATIGATVGFNLMPVLIGLASLLLLKGQPRLAIKISLWSAVGIMATVLLLNVIDTDHQFYGTYKNSYTATLKKGQSVYLFTDAKLSGEQYAKVVDDFSTLMDNTQKDHVKAMADAEAGGLRYWVNQFWQGFRVPLINARCPHAYNGDDVHLSLPRE